MTLADTDSFAGHHSPSCTVTLWEDTNRHYI